MHHLNQLNLVKTNPRTNVGVKIDPRTCLMLVFLGLVSKVNHTTVFYQIRTPLELVIANQPCHYASIWDSRSHPLP